MAVELPTVGERAEEDIGLFGECMGCKKRRYYRPDEAVARFGRDTPIKEAEQKLRCPCGGSGRARPHILLRSCIKDYYRRSAKETGFGGKLI